MNNKNGRKRSLSLIVLLVAAFTSQAFSDAVNYVGQNDAP